MFNKKINIKKEVVEAELTKLRKLYNNRKLSLKNINQSSHPFNCWGFIAFIFKWLPHLEWFYNSKMEYCLAKFTKLAKRPKVGDIVVMRTFWSTLEHTAVLVDVKKMKIIHKPGGCKLEVNDLDNIIKLYGNIDKIEFRRALPNKKFDMDKFIESNFNKQKNKNYYA